jgi:hypothetical protein
MSEEQRTALALLRDDGRLLVERVGAICSAIIAIANRRPSRKRVRIDRAIALHRTRGIFFQ